MIPTNALPFVSKSQYFTDETHVFKLAVSSNNFLGFSSSHPIRKNDCFDVFDEVLKRCRFLNVDVLTLGGNLFDQASPSQEVLHRAVSLIKSSIFGDKPINFEVLWGKQAPNYACENMNIDLPIFVIQGKRESMSNEGSLNVLDVLHAGNYVFSALTKIAVFKVELLWESDYERPSKRYY